MFIFTAFVTYANAQGQAADTVTTASATNTPVLTPTVTPIPTPTVTPAVSPSPTPSSTVSPSATPIPTASPALKDISQPKVDITPDNPIYPIKRLIESVQVTLTFSPQGKAELLVSFAKERLAEAEIMTKKNKDKVVEKIMKAFTNIVKKANKNIDVAALKGNDVTAVLEEIKVVEDSADKMIIKVTGVIPQNAADSLKTSVSDTVKTTLTQKSLGVAKSNLKAAKEELNVTKNEYKMAQEAGSVAAVKAIEDKLTQSQQNKNKAEEILKNVEAYKDQLKAECKVSDAKNFNKEKNKEKKNKEKKHKNKNRKMKDCLEKNEKVAKNFNMEDENDFKDNNCENSRDNDDDEND